MRQCDYLMLREIESKYLNGEIIKWLLVSELTESDDRVMLLLKYLTNTVDIGKENPKIALHFVSIYREEFNVFENARNTCAGNWTIWRTVFELVLKTNSLEIVEKIVELLPSKLKRWTSLMVAIHYKKYLQHMIVAFTNKNKGHLLVRLITKTRFCTWQFRDELETFLKRLFISGRFKAIIEFAEYDPTYIENIVDYLDTDFVDKNPFWPVKRIRELARSLLKIDQKNGSDVCPNAYHHLQTYYVKSVIGLLIQKRFHHNSMGSVQFCDLVKSVIDRDNVQQQLDCLEKLNNYEANWEIQHLFFYFQISDEHVDSWLANIVYDTSDYSTCSDSSSRRGGRGGHNNSNRSGRYMQLQLHRNHIHFVKSKRDFWFAIRRLRNANVIGIDTEWKPFSGRFGHGSNVAIFQLATRTDVFLIDVFKLHLSRDCWNGLMDVLKLTSIKKVGFKIADDIRRLNRSVPNIDHIVELTSDFIDVGKLYEKKQNTCSYYDSENYDTSESNSSPNIKSSKRNKVQSLNNLVCELLNCELDKTWQLSNWEQRPLRPQQITYAALDAYCLIEIFDCLTMPTIIIPSVFVC